MWTTAADYCDQLVDGVPRFRAGYEVRMATAEHGGDEPFDVVDQLLKACAASIVDAGGAWLIRSGPAGLPLAFTTDDDIVVSRPQDFEPHQGLTDVYNAVRATFPDPGQDWAAVEAPLRRDAAAEEQDGERLVADLQLPAVFDRMQVQRLQNALLKDARRMRRHTVTLPPEFDRLEALDVLPWSSARNGYVNKLFEVAEKAVEPNSGAVTLALREVEPSDYDWQPSSALPSVPVSTRRRTFALVPLPGFVAQPRQWGDDAGRPRRAGVRLAWRWPLTNVATVGWQVRRRATGEVVARGQEAAEEAEALIWRGLIPGVSYEARGIGRRPNGRPATRWSAWARVDVPDVRLDADDLAPGAVNHVRGVFAPRTRTITSTSTWVALAACRYDRLAGLPVRIECEFDLDAAREGTIELGLWRGSTRIDRARRQCGPKKGRWERETWNVRDRTTSGAVTVYELRAPRAGLAPPHGARRRA